MRRPRSNGGLHIFIYIATTAVQREARAAVPSPSLLVSAIQPFVRLEHTIEYSINGNYLRRCFKSRGYTLLGTRCELTNRCAAYFSALLLQASAAEKAWGHYTKSLVSNVKYGKSTTTEVLEKSTGLTTIPKCVCLPNQGCTTSRALTRQQRQRGRGRLALKRRFGGASTRSIWRIARERPGSALKRNANSNC